ncbi:MAG: hypothetical protein K0Q59_2156 [Paenibacillus sp.]|jgi:hypothetical protein|nr:hypothetical protein [Paenibacillus sp.]
MSQAPLYFKFTDAATAKLALDTFVELSYHAHATEKDGASVVQLFLDHNDLTSALEIAQANGGTLLDTDERTRSEWHSYQNAYELDAVPIPAHVVNEDWPDAYFTSDVTTPPSQSAVWGAAPDGDSFDPSGEDYDHFSAGVRL